MVAVLKGHIGLADHAQKMPSWGLPEHFPCFSCGVWDLDLLTHMHFMFLQVGTKPLSCSVTSRHSFTWQKGPQERRQWRSAARNSWALPPRSWVGRRTFHDCSLMLKSSHPKTKPLETNVKQPSSSLLEHKGTTAGWELTSQTHFNSRATIHVLTSFSASVSGLISVTIIQCSKSRVNERYNHQNWWPSGVGCSA